MLGAHVGKEDLAALLEGDDGKVSLHRKNTEHARGQPIQQGDRDAFLAWAMSWARDVGAAERTYRALEREYRKCPRIKKLRTMVRDNLTNFDPDGEELN